MACLALAMLSLPMPTARAAQVTLRGSFSDRQNAALIAADRGAPRFDDELDVANNLAVYQFTLDSNATVSFESRGATLGGAEPYLSLFQGTSSSAGFVRSSFTDPSEDFFVSVPLVAGSYTLALGVWQNMSFAENLATGALADGFIALGVPADLGDASYQVVIQFPAPEPAFGTLLGAGLLGLLLLTARSPRTPETTR